MDPSTELRLAEPLVQHHYNDLKVAPDAPAEVIRAAYRALAQKHHPDRHQGSPRHAAMLATLNKAQEVLLDPARRAEHDRWIRDEHRRLRARAPVWGGPQALGTDLGGPLRLARSGFGPAHLAGPHSTNAARRLGLWLAGLLLIGMLAGAARVVFADDERPARDGGGYPTTLCTPES